MIKKILIGLVITAALSGAGVGSILYFDISFYSREAFSMIPNDAIYFMETDEPIKSWKEWSQSQAWQHLKTQAYFSDIAKNADALDKMLKENEKLVKMIGEHELILSAHKYKEDDYEFLYIIDIGQKGQLSALFQNYFSPFLGRNYETSRSEYKKISVIELFDKTDKSTLYIALVDNLTICSYEKSLVLKSIDLKDVPEGNFTKKEPYKEVTREVGSGGIGRIYWQYAYLDDFIRFYTPDENPYIKSLSEAMYFSGLEFTSKNGGSMLKAEGVTNINPEVSSYLRALLLSGNGKVTAPRVIPQHSSFFFSLTFENFNDFLDNTEAVIQEEDEKEYEAYTKKIARLEKYLDISIREDVGAWISNEIAIAQIESNRRSEDEFALIIKSGDIRLAREKLSFLAKRIQKKTPVKFKSFEYRNHTISYLAVKGFFKILLGNYFDKIEKPYFTIIEDYVVFSNNPSTLRVFVDDYEDGLTLAKSEVFRDFFSNFNNDSNVFGFINTPVLYKNILPETDPETQVSLKKNNNYVISFPQIGFQFEENDMLFDTRIIAQYKKPEEVRKELNEFLVRRAEKHEQAAKQSAVDKIFDMFSDEDETERATVDDFKAPDDAFVQIERVSRRSDVKKVTQKDGLFTEIFYEQDGVLHGVYKKLDDNGTVRVRGRYKKGKKHGTWKFFDEYGKLDYKTRFKNGKE